MQRASFARMECPIARAVEEIGDGWSILVIREALKGARLFSDFEDRLPIAPNTLTDRLRKLCVHGLLRRRRYSKRPARCQYALTPKALDLLPIVLALGEWGNRWVLANGPTIVAVDARTGEPLDLSVIDRRTGRPVTPGSVALVAGSAASEQLKARLSEPLVLGRSGHAS